MLKLTYPREAKKVKTFLHLKIFKDLFYGGIDKTMRVFGLWRICCTICAHIFTECRGIYDNLISRCLLDLFFKTSMTFGLDFHPYRVIFLNGIIQLTFLTLAIVSFRDINLRTWRWSVNSTEPGQTARTYRLAWLYTGGKD